MLELVWNDLGIVALLAASISAVSMTITMANISNGFRAWVKARSKFFGELFSCPYCTSHWLSFGAIAIYQPRPVSSQLWPVDLLVSVFIAVTLSAFCSGLIFKALSELPHEDE